MTLQGKGFFIWKIRDCEKGNPQAIASAAQAANLTHVLVKIADGGAPFNISPTNNVDLVPPVVEALKARGMKVWGWQYIYGYDPNAEARIAIKRLQTLGLDGFVIDAEAEFKQPGRASAARRYAQQLRSALPDLPLALSSFRFPSYHRAFPWTEFLQVCNLNMPQVYWEKAHNPAAQLRRCVSELTALKPSLPVVPTAPTYKTGGWRPTPKDLNEFFECVHELQLTAANFFSWDECTRDLPELWQTMSAHIFSPKQPPQPDPVPTPPAPSNLLDPIFKALAARSLDDLLPLYYPDAIHVSNQGVIKGEQALRAWYQDLWTRQLPDAAFTFVSAPSLIPGFYRFTWKAQSGAAAVDNGSDSLGILDGKIAVHYTQYHVIKRA